MTPLQATTRGLVKLRFLVGLAARLAEAIGRDSDPHHQLRLGEVAAQVEVLAGVLRGGIEEVADRLRDGPPWSGKGAFYDFAVREAVRRHRDVLADARVWIDGRAERAYRLRLRNDLRRIARAGHQAGALPGGTLNPDGR